MERESLFCFFTFLKLAITFFGNELICSCLAIYSNNNFAQTLVIPLWVYQGKLPDGVCVQTLGENAPSQLILYHYPDLKEEKGIVLMTAEMDPKFIVSPHTSLYE